MTLFVVPIMYTLLLREGGDTEADIEAELADEPALILAEQRSAGHELPAPIGNHDGQNPAPIGAT